MYRHTLTPRFSDLDVYNHVNNAVYLTYFEEARVAFTRDIGMRDLFSRSSSTILAHASIDYKAPAMLGDVLNIDISVGNLGRSSFAFDYHVTRASDGALIALGKSVQVCFNFDLNTPVRIPDAWRDVLTRHRPQP
jgi:acyl-CoA thioester hydrolase